MEEHEPGRAARTRCSSLISASAAEILGAQESLRAVAKLLQCVDEDAWCSLARPSARELATLLHMIAARFDDAIEAAEIAPLQ